MDKPDQTQMDYMACFSSNVGRRVLAHLMADAGVFDIDLKTSEELAVENFAKKILVNMGIYGDTKKVQQITDAIINQV